jgi:hypothetical protein
MNLREKILRFFAVLVIMGIFTSAQAENSADEYLGTLEDGSTLRIITVNTDAGLMIKEVGYKFTATKIGVDQVYSKDGKPFGDPVKDGVNFQVLVLLKFVFGSSLMSESGGSTNMAAYDVSVTEVEPNKLVAVMTLAKSVNEKYNSLGMRNISLGPGGRLEDKYTFNLTAKK